MNTDEFEKHVCRVCGLFYPDWYPWGEDGKTPDWDICSCCGAEWGYEDGNLIAASRYREKWLQSGAQWLVPSRQPADWDLTAQLAQIPAAFRSSAPREG